MRNHTEISESFRNLCHLIRNAVKKRHQCLQTKEHVKQCCKSSNIKVALAAVDALRNNNIPLVLSFFAPGAVIDFHGDSANLNGIPIIPFAGTFPAAQFFTKSAQFITTNNVGPVTDIEFDCFFNYVSLTLNLTSTPRCSPTSPNGPTQTLENIFKFTFNQQCQITRVDIFTDTSGLTLFFATACGPLAGKKK